MSGRRDALAAPPGGRDGEPRPSIPVLKGDAFRARLERVFAADLPRRPLPDLRRRRVLVPGLSGGELHFCMLGLVAQALRVRGAEVTALACDQLLPACVHRKIDHHQSACTRWCHRNAGPFARAMRLPLRWYGEFIGPAEIDARAAIAAAAPARELARFEWRGLPVGRRVLQSTGSYYKLGTVDLERPDVLATARGFLHSALLIATVAERALERLGIDRVFMDNGVQVDWGVFRDVAERRGVPVTVAQHSPRANHLQFESSHADRAARLLPEWPRWRSEPLSGQQEADLDRYLAERDRVPYLFKHEDWSRRTTDPDAAGARLGLRARRDGPRRHERGLLFAMFPNVGYDANVLKEEPAYHDAAEWIRDTVAIVAGFPEHSLVIKAHPAEFHLDANDPVGRVLESLRPRPDNVHFLDPRSDLTAQCLLRLADVALLYTSTVSIEAAALGVPMIMVGDGFHARRGLAEEPATAEGYRSLLGRVCARELSPMVPPAAGRRYAYASFFRIAMPMRLFDRLDHEVTAVHLRSVHELAPGADPALDAICRGVLCDEPIVNPHA